MNVKYISPRGNAKDITGQRFFRLVALGPVGRDNHGKIKWLCQCDCGEQAVVQGNHLRSGQTKSCGCANREATLERSTTHGLHHDPLYRVWTSMKDRCHSPRNKSYSRYGGRGISVCDEWNHDFQAFYDHVVQLSGYEIAGMTLDRIDNDGDYEPGNVRWATNSEQGRNTSVNVVLEFNGKTQCVTAWAEELGMKATTLWHRIRMGWSVERMLTEPVHDPHTARAKLLRLGRDNTVRVQHDAEADAQQYRMVLTEAVQHAIRRAPRRVKRIQEQTEAGNA